MEYAIVITGQFSEDGWKVKTCERYRRQSTI